MATTNTTTIEAFFSAIATRLQSQLSMAANRCFVVDKMMLVNSAVPNFQIEPSTLIIMGEETGLNVFAVEYKVHAVVKVEYDFDGKKGEQLTKATGAKGAFQRAFDAASALNKHEPTGAENQVFLRLDNGGVDETTGLAYATATFRSYVRVLADG